MPNTATMASLVAQEISIHLQGRRPGFDPWVGKIPGDGNGSPLQYSCLENTIDRGAWQATVHGVAKSRTRLSDSHTQLLSYHKHVVSRVLNMMKMHGVGRETALPRPGPGCTGGTWVPAGRPVTVNTGAQARARPLPAEARLRPVGSRLLLTPGPARWGSFPGFTPSADAPQGNTGPGSCQAG